jgi:hypothetical protein
MGSCECACYVVRYPMIIHSPAPNLSSGKRILQANAIPGEVRFRLHRSHVFIEIAVVIITGSSGAS